MADAYLYVHTKGLDEALKQVEELEKRLKNLSNVTIKINTGSFTSAGRQMAVMESRAIRIANAFQSIGNGLQGAGRMMQGISNMFGGRFVNTFKTMTSAFATAGIYGAAQGTVQRYDTMRMFPKMMQHLGYKPKAAEKAVKELEDAVIGLPTGLDEIVASARQLIPLTGSLKKGTRLAIAANNAFLAGGADAQSVAYGQRQIKDLLSKGTLRSQEWDSLFTSLGSGLGVIAEAMGYSSKAKKDVKGINDQIANTQSRLKSLYKTRDKYNVEGGTAKQVSENNAKIAAQEANLKKLEKQQDKSLGSFRAALKSNQIDALDFLKALEKVGTGQGELAKRADDYKDTISATARNIKNALQKLGAAGLDSLDSVLERNTGKNLPRTIVQVSDAIKKNMVPALEGWMDAHSGEIVNFLDRLKSYDWTGLISKVGNGLAKYYDIMSTFFTKMSPAFVSFMAVWGGPIGRAMNGVGTSLMLIGRAIKYFASIGSAKKAVQAAGAATGVFKAFSFKESFGKLALSAGYIAELGLLAKVIQEYAKVMNVISDIKIGPNFKSNADQLLLWMGGSAGFTALLNAVHAVITSSGMGWVMAGAEGLTAGFVGIMQMISDVIKSYVETVDSVAKMKIPEQGKVADLLEATSGMINMLGEIPVIKTGKIDNVESLSEAMDYLAQVGESVKKIKDIGNIGNQKKKIDALLEASKTVISFGFTRQDKKQAKDASKTLENISGAVSSVGKIAGTLAASKGNIAKIIRKNKAGDIYTNLGGRITEIVQAMLKSFEDNHLQFRTKEKQVIDDNLKRIAESVTSIGSIATTLATARKDIDSLITKNKKGDIYTNVGNRIGKIITSIVGPFSNMEIFTDEEGRTIDFNLVKKNAGQIAKATESVASIVKSIYGVKGKINKLGLASYGNEGLGATPFTKMMAGLKQILPSIASVYRAIPEVDDDSAGNAKSLATALGNMSSIVKSLAEVKKPVKELGVTRDDWTLGARLRTMFNSLSGAFSGMIDGDYSSLASNAKSMMNAVSNIKTMVANLQNIQKVVDGFEFKNGTWTLGTKLARVMGSLAGAFGGSGEGVTGLADVAVAALKLGAIGEALGVISENASGAAKGLNRAASGMNRLGKASQNHSGNITKAATAVGKLKSAAQGIAGYANGAAGGVTNLGNQSASQIGNLNAAASAASNLASAIASIPSTKTVTVNTSLKNTFTGGLNKIIQHFKENSNNKPKHKHSGGLIYRAGGGWTPRGTDTVPAMLTPGEYVVRRSAVNHFGRAFMNRVNSLDIDGAIRSLSIRAGSRVRGGSYVTNNYRDNHSQVTINNHNASQGYSQRVANRWVRSLS